ncbi:MAG: hypothetical protein LCH58_05985 [Bacteroidetes bacterium]|uniref:hypothetical protein n=1 Tax=Phnomibacter sp. TaxID=2836217 RepID=UPI002FDD83FB|nr:hypothetical protein [Bacteroidota bacterium]
MQPATDNLEVLNFSYNWNNKLQCKAYTTIRLYGRKYQQGKRFQVQLKGENLHVAEVVEIKPFYLQQLNEFMAYVDTGYSSTEARDIVIRMYPRVDVFKQQMCMVLLRVITEKNITV